MDALGGQLPAVAGWYGKTPEAFRAEILRDVNLRLDNEGRLYAVGRAQTGRLPPPPLAFARPVIDGAFDLHSKPGAPKSIVLEFRGADISATRWNKASGTTLAAPAFDNDGQPGFNQSELWDIVSIWRRVAEDFAPFDVDVTTAPAAGADEASSVRIVVTTELPSVCKCGLAAYVDSFGSGEPALVFAASLNNGAEKSVAEAISHAIGRTLGLGADGVQGGPSRYAGQGAQGKGWAPIMGNASFQETSLFDKGSYAGATNTEDDFAVMQRHLALRADDAGNTVAAATPLAAQAVGNGLMRLNREGVIEQQSDFDVYSFTAGQGMIKASVAPAPTGPNAEMYLMLLNASGVPVQISGAGAAIPAISYAATPGTYFLRVMASGKMDAPDYGALGTYSLSVEYAEQPNQPPTADFTVSAASGPAPLTVAFDASPSRDDGTILRYQWNFQSGMATVSIPEAPQPVSQEQSPSWTYKTPGTYTAVLRVQDDRGQWSEWTSRTITVGTPIYQPPVAAFTFSPSGGPAPLAVTFDGSGSTDEDGVKLYRWSYQTPSGAKVSIPSSSQPTLTRTFDEPGQYAVSLTVYDAQGFKGSVEKTITVTEPANANPVASFSADKTNGHAPLMVTFDASASSDDGTIVTYSWDFGDGSGPGLLKHYQQDITNQKQPVIGHYFFKSGTYDVILKVTDENGHVSDPVRKTITVLPPNEAPQARFTAMPVDGSRHLFELDASASTDDQGIVAYIWDFGNGILTRTSEPRIRHIFPDSHSPRVILSVEDAFGLRGAIGHTVGDWGPFGQFPEVQITPSGNRSYVALHANGPAGSTRPLEPEVQWSVDEPVGLSGSAALRSMGGAYVTLPRTPGTSCSTLRITGVHLSGHFHDPNELRAHTYCDTPGAFDRLTRPVMVINETPSGKSADVTVQAYGSWGYPRKNVRIVGKWSGAAEGVTEAMTDENGRATFTYSLTRPGCARLELFDTSKGDPHTGRAPDAPRTEACTSDTGTDVIPTSVFTAVADGVDPLAFNFDASASSDDDAIRAYFWDWGDQTLTSTKSPVTSHAYAKPGTYKVKLTVKDSSGLYTTSSQTVTGALPAMIAQRPEVVVTKEAGGFMARATVLVTDQRGNPVHDAEISASWLYTEPGTATARTDANGIATITSQKSAASSCFMLRLDGATHPRFTFDPGTASSTVGCL